MAADAAGEKVADLGYRAKAIEIGPIETGLFRLESLRWDYGFLNQDAEDSGAA